MAKLTGFEFFKKALGSPAYIVAPMVDQSELAWRILSRRYGAQLCYTPMFHARLFSQVPTYRDEQWQTNQHDRPLVVQFCANDADTLLQAAKLVENDCDAVDINLGCPQDIARRGKYGSFLQDDWECIAAMVRTLHQHLKVPVTCKIRVFPEVEKTLAYARMIADAGCQMLVVHGRTREMKGHNTGVADWEQIRRVKEALSDRIPVIANGNILEFKDVAACMEATGADGVMSAEGNLYNPALFAAVNPTSWELAQEYLDITARVPTKTSIIRGHLFKLFKPCLHLHTDLRDGLANAASEAELRAVVQELRVRLQKDAAESNEQSHHDAELDITRYPHWYCQPYIRAPLAPPKASSNDQGLSKKQLKKRARLERAGKDPQPGMKKPKITPCLCGKNVASASCVHNRCRQCCRQHEQANVCPQHARQPIVSV